MIWFLYASERGNAECIAKQMHNEAVQSRGFPDSQCMTLDAALKDKVLERTSTSGDDPPVMQEATVVIVCSTSGDGDVPENGGRFKRWLRNTTTSLTHVRFTVLALGDTNYNNFCAAGKFIDSKLEFHGARRFYTRGEADDAFGLELVVDAWTAALWAALANVASSADKLTVVGNEAPVVVDMKTPMTALVIYSPDMARIAHYLHERIWELGGVADIAPSQFFNPARAARPAKLIVILTSVRDAQAGKLGSIGRLIGGLAGSPSQLDASRTADEEMASWMRSNLGFFSLMCTPGLSLDSILPPAGAQPQLGDTSEVAVATKLHEQMFQYFSGASLKLEPLCKKQADHFSPVVVGLHEHVYTWLTVLLDCLPGVTADVIAIRATMDRTFQDLAALAAGGGGGGGHFPNSPPSGGPSTPKLTSRDAPVGNSNALVNFVLTPLVIMYSSGSSLVAEVAHSIHALAEQQSLPSAIVDASNYKRVAFPRQATFVFVVGTDTSKSSIAKLFKYIKSLQAEGRTMEKVRFAILGIDDREASEKFNACALQLEYLLLALKATKVYCTGLVDTSDAQSSSAVTMLWVSNLWGSLEHPQPSSAYLDAASVNSQNRDGTGSGDVSSQSWFPWESVPLREDSVPFMSILFLYSSSGMAKTFAAMAAKEAELFGFDVSVSSFNKYSSAELHARRFVIFFCESSHSGLSTGGSKMKRHLRRSSLSPDTLSALTYAVLGLGPSNHRQQHPAQELAALLSHLQANRVFPVTTLDSISQLYSHGIPWSRGVLAAMTNTPQASSLQQSSAVQQDHLGNEAPLSLGVAESSSLSGSRMLKDAPSVLFLYGSVTGSAEAVARDLHREALERGCASRVAELQHFEKMRFTTSRLVVIVCCTTSVAGSCYPSNASRFVKYISRQTLPIDHLANTNFAVLGLGSSRYPASFCKAAREIDSRLAELGATRVMPIGLADDCKGIETTVELWRKQLFQQVQLLVAVKEGTSSRSPMRSPAIRPMAAPSVGPECHPVLILYASEPFGHAARAATNLYNELSGELYETEIAPLEDFEKATWRRYRVVLFMISTGVSVEEPAANATTQSTSSDHAGLHLFLKFIRQKSHPRDLLSGMKYTVLGFDNAGNPRFCEGGRFLDRRLEELGAMRFYARGEVDVTYSNLELALEPWVSNLWPALRIVTMPPMSRLTDVGQDRLTAGRVGGTSGGGSSECSSSAVHRMISTSEPGGRVIDTTIKKWRQLSPPCAENIVILLSLGVTGGTSWNPGDAISIFPRNDEAEVNEILDLLGAPGEEIFLPVSATSQGADTSYFPGSPIYGRLTRCLTNREVLTLVSSLRVGKINFKSLLSLFKAHATSLSDQSILHSWLNSDNSFQAANKQQHLTLLEVLRKFGSSRPPFRHVVECLVPLQPRYYSICSDHSTDPTTLDICFKVIPNGLCTGWLYRLCLAHSSCTPEGGSVTVGFAISLRDSSEFKMPADPQIPLILIGPGTGVSPFLSFLQHREHQTQLPNSVVSQATSGEIHVFFGCRSKAEYIFKEELQHFVASRVVHTLHVAFSQEPSEGMWYGGCYVQDKLQECSDYLCNLIINKNAHVYVCGDAESMARDMHRVLIDMIEYYQDWSTQEATAYLAKMDEEGRYQRDIWTAASS